VADLHQLGGFAVLVVAGLLTLTSAGVALVDRGHDLLPRLASVALAVFLVQGLVGVLLMLSASGPREWLHVVYGVVLAGIVPLASSFTAEAPPRSRSWVLALTGVIALLLAWRLFGTG
jgi:hypothetical protein